MTFDAAKSKAWFGSLPVAKEPFGFGTWKAKVDALISAKCGITSDDLPDYCYRDAFEDGATPAQAAKAAIKAAKEF